MDPQLPGLVREWFGARGPVAVPGTAVVAVLPVLVREELDRHLHRSSGSVEARRYVRMLRRLVEVDAGLTGRHRGDVATSLRWMTVEPYRPVVAGIDATLLTQL